MASLNFSSYSCEEVVITHPYLEAVAAQPALYEKIRITIQHNCCPDEEVFYEIPPTFLVPPDFSITVDDSVISGFSFSSGVWTFTVEIFAVANPENPEAVMTGCLFLDCDDFKCEIAKYLADLAKEKTAVHMAYFGLINANDCEDKCCQDMCDIYEYLLIQLNKIDDESCVPCR